MMPEPRIFIDPTAKGTIIIEGLDENFRRALLDAEDESIENLEAAAEIFMREQAAEKGLGYE